MKGNILPDWQDAKVPMKKRRIKIQRWKIKVNTKSSGTGIPKHLNEC